MSQGTEKLKQDAKNSLQRASRFLNQSSFGKQLIAGTASGWVTGVVTGRVGKPFAVVAGTGILVFQVAQHYGIVSSDMFKGIEHESHSIGGKYIKSTSSAVNTVRSFATKNKVFTAGFVGGFLIGVAF